MKKYDPVMVLTKTADITAGSIGNILHDANNGCFFVDFPPTNPKLIGAMVYISRIHLIQLDKS